MTGQRHVARMHYVVWRDKDGDVREVKRYRKASAATEARDRHIAKHAPHTGQPDELPNVTIYAAESFLILLGTHPDFDIWGDQDPSTPADETPVSGSTATAGESGMGQAVAGDARPVAAALSPEAAS